MKFRNNEKVSVTSQTFSVVLTTSSDCYLYIDNLYWTKKNTKKRIYIIYIWLMVYTQNNIYIYIYIYIYICIY